MLHAPMHPVLKDLKRCKAEDNFEQNWAHKPAGLGTKIPQQLLCWRAAKTTAFRLQSRAAWLMLLQPSGNFTGLSTAEELCAGIHWGFTIKMCTPCRKRHNRDPWASAIRIQAAPCCGSDLTPGAGFCVCLCSGDPFTMCWVVSLLQNTWPPQAWDNFYSYFREEVYLFTPFIRIGLEIKAGRNLNHLSTRYKKAYLSWPKSQENRGENWCQLIPSSLYTAACMLLSYHRSPAATCLENTVFPSL